MKKLCIPVLAIGLLLSFNNAPGYRIQGNIPGAKEGIKVYLKYADIPDLKNRSQDSTVIHNGQFEFTGQLSSPRYYKIMFKDPAKPEPLNSKFINLFIENATITVQAPYDSLLSIHDVITGKKTSPALIIKGSSSNLIFTKYNESTLALDEQYSNAFKQYAALFAPGKDSGYQSRKKRMELCNNMDEIDSLSKKRLLQFVNTTPADEVTAYIALSNLNMSKISTRDVDELIRPFLHAKQKDVIAKKLLEQAMLKKKTALGSEVVKMSFADTSGVEHALSDYIGKGKYVMLECWASWCNPCRADIPNLKEVYDLYHPDGFEIISVSMDTDRSAWLKAVGVEKMKWLQLSDLKGFKGELPAAYHINSIPACLLFDPQGRLVARNFRGGWMDKGLIKLYGNYFAK